MRKLSFIYSCISLFIITSCFHSPGTETVSGLEPKNFQTEFEKGQTDLYILKNQQGMEVCITNYGARVVSVMVPDRNGVFEDVVAGFPTIQGYLENQQNFGAIIGRYMGRIKDARFSLDGVEYKLVPNKDTHIAHGGDPGFAVRLWTLKEKTDNSVRLNYLSPDGENGFPGNLSLDVIYTVTPQNELDIRYEATSDAPTVLNITNHAFFNISGDFTSTVEDQIMYVNGDSITPYDAAKCVTGEIVTVGDSPFDFRTPRKIGDRIDEDNFQLNVTGGYDHLWVLNDPGNLHKVAAGITDLRNGRTLEVYTTEPGIHVYAGSGLKGNMKGKEDVVYNRRSSICFETMHFQDSPNQPHFPSTVLRPGEIFESHTIFRFGVLTE